MPVIENKIEMYKLYSRGLFGNRLRTWQTPQECIEDNPGCLLGMRYAGTTTNWPVKIDFRVRDLPALVTTVVSQGFDYNMLRVSERSDDTLCLVNGEIYRSDRHFDLHYSTEKTWMRPALKTSPLYAKGYKAKAVMEHFLDPTSWDDIQDLMDIYPNHVVEFTAFSRNVGICPHRNTVVWEVRKHYGRTGNEFIV